MSDDRSKTPRTILVADHLWEAFATMGVEMGSDRDALINQALYTFARLNGFLVAADIKKLTNSMPGAPQEPSRPRATAPLPPSLVAVPDERPAPRHGNPDRVAALAQQLAGSNMPARSSNPPPPPPVGAPVKAEP